MRHFKSDKNAHREFQHRAENDLVVSLAQVGANGRITGKKGTTKMETAMKVEELNMAPCELTLGELDSASGGVPIVLTVPLAAAGLAIFSAGIVGGFFFGRWLAQKLN